MNTPQGLVTHWKNTLYGAQTQNCAIIAQPLRFGKNLDFPCDSLRLACVNFFSLDKL